MDDVAILVWEFDATVLGPEEIAADTAARLAAIHDAAALVEIVTRWNPACDAADQPKPPDRGTPGTAWDKKLARPPQTRTHSTPVTYEDDERDERAVVVDTLDVTLADEWDSREPS